MEIWQVSLYIATLPGRSQRSQSNIKLESHSSPVVQPAWISDLWTVASHPSLPESLEDSQGFSPDVRLPPH